jgi:hypothetical protein
MRRTLDPDSISSEAHVWRSVWKPRENYYLRLIFTEPQVGGAFVDWESIARMTVQCWWTCPRAASATSTQAQPVEAAQAQPVTLRTAA